MNLRCFWHKSKIWIIIDEVKKNIAEEKKGRAIVRKGRVGPPKTRTVKVYMTSLHYSIYALEARRRGVSLSELFNVSIYEFIYRPSKGSEKSDIPIFRVDRTPKGLATPENLAMPEKMLKKKKKKEETIRDDFINVVQEIKGFDLGQLEKVPDSEKHHVYNIYTQRARPFDESIQKKSIKKGKKRDPNRDQPNSKP